MSQPSLSPHLQQTGTQGTYFNTTTGQYVHLPTQPTYPDHPPFAGMPQPLPPRPYLPSIAGYQPPDAQDLPAHQNYFAGPVQCGPNPINQQVLAQGQGNSVQQNISAPQMHQLDLVQQFMPAPQMQQHITMLPTSRNFNGPDQSVRVQRNQGPVRADRSRRNQPYQQSKLTSFYI